MESSEYILGIDGGGSKTVALLADAQGSVLGRGTAGSSNFQAHTLDELRVAVQQAVDAAFADAGLSPCRVAALCVGLGGADRPADLRQAQALLAQMNLARRLRVMNDGWLLLWSGSLQGVGVGLVAGTGSIAFGRDSAGRTARAGGWGWRLGDEGSGYAVALSALQAVTRAADGRAPHTSLTAALLTALELEEPSALIPYIYRHNPSAAEIARLAPLVLAEAQRGDETARAILLQAAQELSRMLQAVAGRLNLKSPFPCALGGGWLVHADEMVRLLVDDLERAGIHLEPLECVHEPALGALRLAQKDLFQ